ncbi:MAG: hypothetical protein AB8H86_22065 [Polyangiales bacterium]
MRYLPALILGAIGGVLSLAAPDLSITVQLIVLALGIAVVLIVMVVASSARALKANGGKLTFVDLAESQLDEELLLVIRELEEMGFRRSGEVIRPVGSNYNKEALLVFMFNEDATVVVQVGRLCGPLMASHWSVFDIARDTEVQLLTSRERIYTEAGPNDLWQSFPDTDLATRGAEHARALEMLTARGAAARPMNTDACKTGLQKAFERNRARLLPSLTWNVLRMYGRALTKRSNHDERIDEQNAAQEVLKRIAERSTSLRA